MRCCANCGTDISDMRADAKFCGGPCRIDHHRARRAATPAKRAVLRFWNGYVRIARPMRPEQREAVL